MSALFKTSPFVIERDPRVFGLDRRVGTVALWLPNPLAEPVLIIKGPSGLTDWKTIQSDADVSVKAFGAKGDGEADDSDALELALNAGIPLSWPRGRYRTTRILLTPAGTRINAEGAVLVPDGDSNDFGFPSATSGAVIGGYGVDDVMIDGLAVDLSENEIVCNGIAFVPKVEDEVTTVCTDVTISRCIVDGFDAHVYMIWTLFGKRIKILMCRVDGHQEEWPLEEPAAPSEGIEAFGGEDVQIIGNSSRRLGGSGISLGAFTADGAEVRGLIAAHNYVDQCRNGVRLTTGENTAQDAPVNIYDVLIQGNLSRRSFNNGILLNTWHVGGEFSNVRIDTNIIDDARSSGIKVIGFDHGADELHRVTVTNNDIRNVAAGDINEAGIYGADMPGLAIGWNRVREGIGHGLRLQRCPSATVEDNFIEKFGGSGIKAEDCDDLALITNKIREHDTGGGSVGILVGNTQRGVITGNTFERTDNSFTGDSTEVIVDSDSSAVSTKGNHRLGVGPFTTALVNNQATDPVDDIIQTADRPLNNIFVISQTVDAEVVYNAQINVGGGGGGEQIELRIGASSPPTEVIDYANIAEAGTSRTVKLVGRVPAGWYVSLVTIPGYGTVTWSNDAAKARERLNPS